MLKRCIVISAEIRGCLNNLGGKKKNVMIIRMRAKRSSDTLFNLLYASIDSFYFKRAFRRRYTIPSTAFINNQLLSKMGGIRCFSNFKLF